MKKLIYLSFIMGAIIISGLPASSQAQSPAYELVKGWPQIPASLTLDGATGVAIDNDDNIYLFHRGTPPVAVFTREGSYLRGFGEDIIKGGAHGITFAPDQTLWVTDINEHVLMQFTKEGKLLKTIGERGKPGETGRNFNKPTNMTFNPSGDFFVTDGYGNSRVVKFNANCEYQFAWGDSGNAPSQFYWPHGAAIDSKGTLYICDRQNSRIQIFTQNGEFITMWTKFGQPWGIDITPDDKIYIADGLNNKVYILNTNGDVLTSWGTKGTGAGEFDLAHGIAVDSKGDVYVTEVTNKRIQKFTTKK